MRETVPSDSAALENDLSPNQDEAEREDKE